MPSPPDLYGSPWQSREEREERRRKRHAYWLGLLTDRDWARITALTHAQDAGHGTARLDDLDAPGIAVGICEPGWETRYSGERIGELRGYPVLVWVKT